MDSLIAAASRALAAGDPLGALQRVALRSDPDALALRGIAMAQLGELERARELLRLAARRFGGREPLARARAIAAEAEVALAARDFGFSPVALDRAIATLRAFGDRQNAAHAELSAIRRLLLVGRVSAAEGALEALDLDGAPPLLVAIAALARADVAVRGLRSGEARSHLAVASHAARTTAIEALVVEVDRALARLDAPAARVIEPGSERLLTLGEIERLFASDALLVDGCRRTVSRGAIAVSFARRPVLFALARALGEAWPHDLERERLIAVVFGASRPNDSHRARLRVEIGRLRAALAKLVRVEATARGFALRAPEASSVSVLAPPIEGDDAALIALLTDGQAWSTSALALALGSSQRTVQRALVELEQAERVRSIGRARRKRWLAAEVGRFASTLLLPMFR
jgi:hypothetical protein